MARIDAALAGSIQPATNCLHDLHSQRALKGTGTEREEVPGEVLDVIGSGGMPVEYPVQDALEDRMDADFSDVRIHTGGKAAQAAEKIDARAFTCGNSIVFNSGEYDPGSSEGQFLLAHELAHVKQQTGGAAISMMPKAEVAMEIDPDPQAEREADEVAERVVKGHEVGLDSMWYTDVHVQRTGAGAPIPGAGGSLAEQTLKEDAEDEDEGFSFRELLASMTKSGMATGSVAVAVQAVAIEVGMTDPQTAMTIGSAGALLSAGVAGKINAYGQLDPQVLRRAFAAAGQEEFLAEILKHLGYEPEWADYGGDDDYNYGGD